ncbi:MAG: hypothetical protein WKG00_02910, partial [Polyangiaceae bacterium]
LLCDRVGASVFTEDLTGASYHRVCHYAADGSYGDQVDADLLAPIGKDNDKGQRARKLGLAKMDALVRRRSQLVRAFNTVFPDIEIDDVSTDAKGDEVRFHDALMSFGQTMAKLYDDNPFGGEPLLPHSTQSLARLFDALADSDEARGALAHIWGRQGYRPSQVGLGAIRASLAYPDLRGLTKATVGVLGPEGQAVPQLQQLLTISKREMLTSVPVAQPLPSLAVAAGGQPNRPRTNVEVISALMLAEDPSFAASDNEPARFISLRDRRGFVVPAGNTPGVPGTVNGPFADIDGDGFADVDAFGRFTDAGGAPLLLDAPFVIPGVTATPADAFGRPDGAPYAYLDTSRALTGAMARGLVPLLDATQYGDAGDPDAWKTENESLMYLLAGAYRLYGGREEAVYDFANSAILPAGSDCTKNTKNENAYGIADAQRCAPYLRFKAEESPLPDLAHAAGQVLADPRSDMVLLGVMDLIENHEPVMARLIGASLRIKEIADEHDAKARAGQERFASLPYQTPIWDEVAEVVGRMAQRPGLLSKLVAALADPIMVSPIGSSQHYGQTLATFATMRDRLTYDPQNLNGPALNLSDGANSTADPKHPVDWLAPLSGDNRSLLHRSIQAISDTTRVRSCNKPGAKVYANLLGGVHWPLTGSYDECELFTIDNLAAFYLGSVLPANHEKRSKVNIKSDTLGALLDFLGASSADSMFEDSSGITGMTLHPTPAALNRLVFFGASSDQYGNLPDFDSVNSGSDTNDFISSMMEPAGTAVCPPKANGVRACASQDDLLRLRDRGTMFAWERIGFLEYLAPVLTVFANEACSEDQTICDVNDLTGENLFLDLQGALYRHWDTKDHGAECSNTGNAESNLRYCSEAGVANYGPILGDAFGSDIIPALHEFSKAAVALQVTVERGPNAGTQIGGAEIVEMLVQMLFDPAWAKDAKIVDRQGKASTSWVDGRPQEQATVYSMFADALHRMDAVFDASCACEGQVGQALEDCREACPEKGQWRRGRSQFVDRFLAVEGSGPEARFKNRSFPRMLLQSLRVLREQLNANCPERESGKGTCTWAKADLGNKLGETMSGPLFATMMDTQEAVRLDEPARREMQRFLAYILEAASADDSLQATLASISDLFQVLANDNEMSAIFRAAATAANPGGDKAGAGCADTTIKVMKALTSDEYDRYHLLDHILPRLVTPMDEGQGTSPVEVFADTIAEVNRIDAASDGPLDAEDYQAVMGTVRDFFGDERRGLEQLYYIVQRAPPE